jgi:hypothetical protein
MKRPWTRNRRRLVLKREQLRQLDTGQLARLLGGGPPPGQTDSAGACTESCVGCHQTTAVKSMAC